MASRQFLLLVHRVPTSGAFTLNDLAGGGGRADEVARVVSTGLTISNDIRRDTRLTLLFRDAGPVGERRIIVDGARVRHLNPDERSTAALIKNALVRSIPVGHELEASPGLTVGPVDVSAELGRFLALPGAIWLTEDGRPLREHPIGPDGFAAVLSDPFDPAGIEREILLASGAAQISVGPRSLRSSQVIDLVQNELDLREARSRPG